MNLEQLATWLKSQGFTVAPNSIASEWSMCKWYAWRRSSLPARRCECNDDKQGIQIVVNPHRMNIRVVTRDSVTLEIRGEAASVWWKLEAYDLKCEEVRDRLSNLEGRLVAAWNALKEEEE